MTDREDRCIYCGAPSTKLCDLVIGFEDPDGDGLYSSHDGKFSDEIFRCDSALCDSHAKAVGFITWPPEFGGFDTVDYCCSHSTSVDLFRPLTREEAESIREQHRWFYRQRWGALRAAAELGKAPTKHTPPGTHGSAAAPEVA